MPSSTTWLPFADKFLGYRVELSDAGDGRILMRVLDQHGIAAGEKVLASPESPPR